MWWSKAELLTTTMCIVIPIFWQKVNQSGTLYIMDKNALRAVLFFVFLLGGGIGFFLAQILL